MDILEESLFNEGGPDVQARDTRTIAWWVYIVNKTVSTEM